VSEVNCYFSSAGTNLYCSIYFPHADENESSDGDKTGKEAEAVTDAPETTATEVQDPPSANKSETVSIQDNTTDEQHEEEPEAKRIKSGHDSAEATEAGETRAEDKASVEDWEKIERDAVPHKVTIEDVVDESDMAAAKP